MAVAAVGSGTSTPKERSCGVKVQRPDLAFE